MSENKTAHVVNYPPEDDTKEPVQKNQFDLSTIEIDSTVNWHFFEVFNTFCV